DGEPELSQQAARMLAFQFPHDPAVKSRLPDTIRKAPFKVRLDASAALLMLKKRPESLVRGLMDLLGEPDRPGSQSQAAYILGEMRGEAREASPALRRALEDKSLMVRQSALLAILRIEPDRAAELTPL